MNIAKVLIGVILGVIIIFIPKIITGQSFSLQNMGAYLVVDYIIRVFSCIIGIIVILLSTNSFFKTND